VVWFPVRQNQLVVVRREQSVLGFQLSPTMGHGQTVNSKGGPMATDPKNAKQAKQEAEPEFVLSVNKTTFKTGEEIVFNWTKVTGATYYYLNFTRENDISTYGVDGDMDASTTQMRYMPRLREGIYYFTIYASNNDTGTIIGNTVRITITAETVPIQSLLSGKAGLNVTYTLNTNTGVLEISGNGPMYKVWTESGIDSFLPPWYEYLYCLSVKSVIVHPGVTTISENAFRDCSNLTSVSLPSSLLEIGYCAFYITGLRDLTIPSNVTSIGQYAFVSDNLQSITFEGNAPTLDSGIPQGASNYGHDIFPATNSGFSIYYQAGASGWTSPTWNGIQAFEKQR